MGLTYRCQLKLSTGFMDFILIILARLFGFLTLFIHDWFVGWGFGGTRVVVQGGVRVVLGPRSFVV
jgi:hypothetical protein